MCRGYGRKMGDGMELGEKGDGCKWGDRRCEGKGASGVVGKRNIGEG